VCIDCPLFLFFSPLLSLLSQGTSECKGIAFVEFFSVEYAEYFAKSFAGSMGDQNSPQLIVGNRAVMIDYASPRGGTADHPHSSSSGSSGGGGDAAANKCDWLCETVSQINSLILSYVF
jgi:hypothetical protein